MSVKMRAFMDGLWNLQGEELYPVMGDAVPAVEETVEDRRVRHGKRLRHNLEALKA